VLRLRLGRQRHRHQRRQQLQPKQHPRRRPGECRRRKVGAQRPAPRRDAVLGPGDREQVRWYGARRLAEQPPGERPPAGSPAVDRHRQPRRGRQRRQPRGGRRRRPAGHLRPGRPPGGWLGEPGILLPKRVDAQQRRRPGRQRSVPKSSGSRSSFSSGSAAHSGSSARATSSRGPPAWGPWEAACGAVAAGRRRRR
jgi:hypothetical protein